MNNIKTKKRFMDRYIDGFMKWMPESLFICFNLFSRYYVCVDDG
ncbi:Short-chain fatty acids transporter [Streptococcus pyogenes]|nr:Short-chain fatty acids transporter [Streptococcus pyogenes]